jgi:type IV secretion system protein TrbI
MPSVKNFRLWPEGAVPRHARAWTLGALVFGLAIFMAVCGRSATAPSSGVKPGDAQPGSTADIERVSAQLEARAAQLRAARGREPNAMGQMATQAEAQQQALSAGISDPSPYPQTQDPMEAARQQFELEMFKRRQLRAFADQQAFSLRDVYGQQKGTQPETKPEEPETKPEAKETAPEPDTTPRYTIREGSFLETVLVNRLDSTFSGPVIVQVSTDVWARDRNTLLIPKGTQVIGEAKAVGSLGQSRVAVVFHRIIRPDDVTVDLDQFTGLNQIGETGLKDKTNNHYIRTFGTSIALGVIGAAAQGSARYGFESGGWDYARQGFGTGMSQAGMNVMNRFLNIPPTVTIREGHRVKVYFTQDLQVPAYRSHQE